MAPVKVCRRCGHDVPIGRRCARCEPAARRARHHPGYDDTAYRRIRAAKAGRPCERCRQAIGRILHHLDGNPAHNTAANLLWACGPCATLLDEQMRADREARRGGKRSPWK